MPVRIGTRASALARTQTGHVAAALERLGLGPVELVPVSTEGDRSRAPLASLGGTGVFVTALRQALLDGRCDVAVHSLKDLPTAPAEGIALAAVPLRDDPADALCARDGLPLDALTSGATVGTGSPRRAAQLRALRPDLLVVDLRGNVDTRLARALGDDADLAAVVLARAGLARLGRLDAISHLFTPDEMLPAPGQGALAIETRADDPLEAAIATLNDPPTRAAVAAERAVLARLEAGCHAPVGALAQVSGTDLQLEAVVAATDGSRAIRHGVSSRLMQAVTPPDDDAGQPSDGRTGAEAGWPWTDELAANAGTQLADLLLELGAATLTGGPQ